jgi:hypothetical protein
MTPLSTTTFASTSRRWMRAASITVVVAAFLYTAAIQSAFLVAFFDGSLLDARLFDAADMIVSLHDDVLTAALLLIVSMLFHRSVTAVRLATAVAAAYAFGVYDFMDGTLHPFLVKLGVYDFVTRGGQTGVTPQVSRSFALLGASAALLALCILRRTRTVDRMFVLLVAGAVVVTTFLFHIALPMGVLRTERARTAETMLTEARYMPIEVFCRDRGCLFLDRAFAEAIGKRVAEGPLPPQRFVERSASTVPFDGIDTQEVRSTTFNGTAFEVDGCVSRHDSRPPATGYLCFADTRYLDVFARTTAAWMGFLSSVAHGVWLYGGMFLLWLHKRRFFRKARGTSV